MGWIIKAYEFYSMLVLLMNKIKKQSQAGGNNKSKTKIPKTNAEITSYLLSNVNQKFVKQVSQGRIIVNPISTNLPQQKIDPSINPQLYYQSIEQSLSALRNSILEHKKAQKVDEKVKLIKAQQLIERMKKEREEYKQKIHQHSKQNILHKRIYSDTVINKMREKLEQRIANKRIEIEERVQAIEVRKKKREEQLATKQIQYKQNLKQIKQKAKSSLKLPTLANLSQKSRASNLSLPKNIFDKIHFDEKQPFKHQGSGNKYLKLSSLKNESIQFNAIEQKNSNRLKKIIEGHSHLSQKLTELENIKSNQFHPYHAKKSKIMGNQFLKESLLLIKKNPSSSNLQNGNDIHDLKESIEIEAQQVHLNKNEQIEKLKEKWERMLSKVKHNEITKEQGLQLLSTIQRRLDKIDLQGVRERLKKKYEALSDQGISRPIDLGKINSGTAEHL